MEFNDSSNVVEEAFQLTMQITGNQKNALKMLRSFDATLETKNEPSTSKNNLLPMGLTTANSIDQGTKGIEILLTSLRKCVEFINEMIKTIEVYYSALTEGIAVFNCGSELTECYELAQYLEREIKYQFSTCVERFLRKEIS